MAYIPGQYQQLTPQEKMKREIEQFQMHNNKSRSNNNLLALLAAIIFVLLVVFGYQYYSHADCVDENYLETIPKCIITEPVKHEREGGRKPYYYTFKFRGHNLECRFLSTCYEYAPNTSLLSTLTEGDTVTVQIDKADLYLFNNQYSEGHINLLNVALKNGFLVDHSYRNAEFNKSHRHTYFVFLIAFTSIILLILVRILLKKHNPFGLFPASE